MLTEICYRKQEGGTAPMMPSANLTYLLSSPNRPLQLILFDSGIVTHRRTYSFLILE